MASSVRCRARDILFFARPHAGVAKLADARDSKSRSLNSECGFDSLLRHQESQKPKARSQKYGLPVQSDLSEANMKQGRAWFVALLVFAAIPSVQPATDS